MSDFNRKNIAYSGESKRENIEKDRGKHKSSHPEKKGKGDQSAEQNLVSGGNPLSVEYMQRDNSEHGKSTRERETLTLCQAL
jgi:hypothetical protein